jgi:Fur family transcriptional regulator, ferric uptake regulator
MQNCTHRLSAAGYKLTAARLAVIQALCELPDHSTSAEILKKVRELDTSIGRASVFRVLDLLCTLAIIHPTYVSASTPEYILMPENGHHAHIICPGCHKVTELESCPFETQLEQIAEENGIRLTGVIVELFSYCPACAALA